MELIKKLNKNHFFIYLFLASIFLIKITPFYYLPIANKLFSSHTLAKLIIGLIFFISLLVNRNQIKKSLSENKKIFLLIILFFISQSLSIINTIDIILFWKSYHNLITALLIFFIGFLFIKPDRPVIRMLHIFLIFTGVIAVFLEVVFLIFPDQFLNFSSRFIQQEVLDAYLTNFFRGRISLDLNTELFLPVFLLNSLFYYNHKIYNKSIFFFLISLIIIFLSIISNFRTRVLCSLFSILMVLVVFFLKIIKKNYRLDFIKNIFNIIFIILIFLLTANSALKLSNNIFRFNVIDRVLMEDRYEDVGSVNFRAASIARSYEIFKAFPLTGIGLGNFIYFNSHLVGIKYSLVVSKSEKNYHELVLYSPHSIFAQTISETGLLGIVFFLVLIGYFIIKDFRLLRYSKTKYIYGYIIASWEIFIFTLFNPSSTIFIIGWFWFLRGIIEVLTRKKIVW